MSVPKHIKEHEILGIPSSAASKYQSKIASYAERRVLTINTAALGAGYTVTTVHQAPMTSVYGVRFVYVNYAGSTQTVTLAKCAPTPSLTDDGSALTWSSITVNGATTWNVAAATGSGVDSVPGVVVSDLIPITQVARTDNPLLYGSNPLIQHRVIRAAGSNPMAMTKDTIAELGDVSLNASMATAISSTDKVTSPTSVSITLSGASPTSIEPGSVMWYGDEGHITIASFGDSLTKGVGTTAYGYSWQLQAVNAMTDSGNNVSGANYGIGSQTHAASMSTARAVIPSTKPSIVTLFAWSPNNISSTDAQVVAMWADFLNTAQTAKDNGAVVIAMTSPPVNSATGAQNTRRVTQNTRLRAAAASGLFLLCDADSVVRDPSNSAQILPAYNTSNPDGTGGAGTGDGIHWNDLGAEAISDLLQSVIYGNSVI